MVLSVREKVSRRWRAFTELMVPDYFGSDACHVAHRALGAARERAHKEQEEVEPARHPSTSLNQDDGEGSSADIEAGGGGGGDADGQKQQQQLVVRGSANSTDPHTLMIPYYGDAIGEGGSPEEERRNKSYDNLYTRIFLIMDEPNWKYVLFCFLLYFLV